MMRAASTFAIVFGLAAISGQAGAQYAPPGPYGAPPSYSPASPGVYPAAPIEDDDSDVVQPGQGVYARPLPPPDGRLAPGYPGTPMAPDARQPYGGPRSASAAPEQGLRPPADVGDSTGAVTQPSGPGGPSGQPVALLPPDYQPEEGPVKELPSNLRRQMVEYWTKEPAGTIIIDTPNTYLYLVLGEGKAMRYGIGVGRDGFTWAGREKVTRMAEWPDWFPPSEMIERQPYLPRFMAGGESNPLGARALYLGKTVYRIHGTNQPSTIGSFVSSGCIRLVNGDVEDLYTRVKVGTRVVVLPSTPAPAAQNQQPSGGYSPLPPASASNQARQTR